MIPRIAQTGDAAEMTRILNKIIHIGGTTAHEYPKTAETVRQDYIDGAHTISCFVAEAAGRITGFQALGWWQEHAHIGTFVDPDVQAKGIGAALFAATCAAAREQGIGKIIASIRADNVPGLAYYARIGFVDVQFDPDFALLDGRVVGRWHRHFDVKAMASDV